MALQKANSNISLPVENSPMHMIQCENLRASLWGITKFSIYGKAFDATISSQGPYELKIALEELKADICKELFSNTCLSN